VATNARRKVKLMNNLLQSIPSPMKIREELERMVLKDVLGPVGGPDEEIEEQSVRDRFLVGMLAPKRQERSPEEFEELPQGGSGPVGVIRHTRTASFGVKSRCSEADDRVQVFAMLLGTNGKRRPLP